MKKNLTHDALFQASIQTQLGINFPSKDHQSLSCIWSLQITQAGLSGVHSEHTHHRLVQLNWSCWMLLQQPSRYKDWADAKNRHHFLVPNTTQGNKTNRQAQGWRPWHWIKTFLHQSLAVECTQGAASTPSHSLAWLHAEWSIWKPEDTTQYSNADSQLSSVSCLPFPCCRLIFPCHFVQRGKNHNVPCKKNQANHGIAKK